MPGASAAKGLNSDSIEPKKNKASALVVSFFWGRPSKKRRSKEEALSIPQVKARSGQVSEALVQLAFGQRTLAASGNSCGVPDTLRQAAGVSLARLGASGGMKRDMRPQGSKHLRI